MQLKRLTLKMKKMVRLGYCPDCDTGTLEKTPVHGGMQTESTCTACGATFRAGAVSVGRMADYLLDE